MFSVQKFRVPALCGLFKSFPSFWPNQIAPFQVHLIGIMKNELRIKEKADAVYKKLIESGVEVLYDDREIGAGEKFADADLIGIPVRLVVSEKSGDNIEWKERTSEKAELLSIEEVLKKLTSE